MLRFISLSCLPRIGPPETMREHVVAAANAMKSGNWTQSRDYILNIKVSMIECIVA